MDSEPDVNTDPRRLLPSVHRMIEELIVENPQLPRWAASRAAQLVLADLRSEFECAPVGAPPFRAGEKHRDPIREAAGIASDLANGGPRGVVNATGIVLHTNLGRAPLAGGAARAAASAAAGYTDLELDLASGSRGDRLESVAGRLRLLSGAEAAYACNNNAAALLLALNTLAAGKQVVVSRGELVEIGGSFRVPEIMQRAGVELVEVGSTNRTHLRDYEAAIGSGTAMLLKVHRSNFEQRGFVKEVELGELVALGERHRLPVLEDLGSGTLVDLTSRGLPSESFVPGRIRTGVDLVCFSGDKLLGGPQAGLVLGRDRHITAMRKNPLARALRLDKMSLAALDWTLGSLLDGRAVEEIPLLGQILRPAGEYRAQTRSFAMKLQERAAAEGISVELSVVEDRVPVGGGSLPGFELHSWVIAVRAEIGSEELAARLRRLESPVLARVRDARLLIDLRSVAVEEISLLFEGLLAVLR